LTVVPVLAPSSEELGRVLDAEMRRRWRVGVRSLARRPHPYRTSFPLEDLDVVLEDGRRLQLVFKDLRFEGLEDGAKLAKASWVHDSFREIEAYRLLAEADLGTPKLYASLADPKTGRYWLFIERIDGVPLWQVGERQVWEAAAVWLAGLHRRFLGVVRAPSSSLCAYDMGRSMPALRRAIQHASGRARHILERIGAGYENVVHRLQCLPHTLVHGDFYASNILVDRSRTPTRIAAADWEMAGIGPGLLDLASLVSGTWSATDRSAMVTAYANAAIGGPPKSQFLADLEGCMLHNAIQFLEVSPAWAPPPGQTHDWLAEAYSAAAELGIL